MEEEKGEIGGGGGGGGRGRGGGIRYQEGEKGLEGEGFKREEE